MGDGFSDMRRKPAPAVPAADEVPILSALRDGARSRADLAEMTGLSRNTVTARLMRLIDTGWVIETQDNQGDRGRPFQRYAINPLAGLIFVARFDAESINGAIVTLCGDIVAEDRQALENEPSPAVAVDQLRAMLDRMTAAQPAVRDRVRVAVIGVPGPVSGRARTVHWSRVGELPADLARRFGMPVLVENDANLMALGAARGLQDAESLLFLLVQTGIGAGLVLDGRIHRGVGGWAGEVGHIPVAAAADQPCICGSRGCVAIITANPGLMRAISTPARPVDTVEALQHLALSRDLDAIMALRQAGRHLGEALTGLVIGIAPDTIAVGGQIAEIGDHVLTGLRESLSLRMPPALSSQLRVVSVPDHNLCGLRGASVMALDLILRPDGTAAAAGPRG